MAHGAEGVRVCSRGRAYARALRLTSPLTLLMLGALAGRPSPCSPHMNLLPSAPGDALSWVRESAASASGRVVFAALHLRGGGKASTPRRRSAGHEGQAMVDGAEAASVGTGESRVVATAPPGHVQVGDALFALSGKGGVVRNPLVQDVGSGWKTVKGKRERVTGIDWDTWRRKRKVTADAVKNLSVAPYEGSGPMLYQDVFGFSGKRVHRKVIRDSWDQMTLEEIKDKTERDAEAYVKAAQLDAEYHQDYVATPPLPAIGDRGRDSDKWKKDLFPHIQSMIENEAKGLHFTGRMETVYMDGKAVRMPTFTNETWRHNIVTGEREQIPGAAHPSTVSIAEHEMLHKYVKERQVEAGALAATRGHGSRDRDVRTEAAIPGAMHMPGVEEPTSQVLAVLQAQAAKGNMSIAEFVDRLKKVLECWSVALPGSPLHGAEGGSALALVVCCCSLLSGPLSDAGWKSQGRVKLSKHKRMLKHVKGFSLENLERMSNGTLVYNSAYGPARVIAGARSRPSRPARFCALWV